MNNRPILDLTVRHFTRVLGEVTVIGTWIGADHEDTEPCIVLVPTHRQTLQITATGVQQRARPCCIALSSAFRYDSPLYLVARAKEFTKAMGFEDTMSRAHRIAEIIHDSIDDLCRMPEQRPVRGSYVGAEATLTEDSGRKRTMEIVTHV